MLMFLNKSSFVRDMFFSVVLAILLCVFIVSKSHADDEGLFYYNPETTIKNYISLTKRVSEYFSKRGHFFFRPFVKSGEVENTIQNKKHGLYLISSWHYRLLKQSTSINPLLVAHSKGKTTQKKVLVVKSTISTIEMLKKKRLSSSTDDAFSRKMLHKMLGKEGEEAVRSLKILKVPKDLDALMSLAFGVADVALSSERSLIHLAKMNPAQYGKLKILTSSDDISLPLITMIDLNNPSRSQKELIDILKSMEKSPDGLRILNMMGLDGFKELSGREAEALSK